MATPPDAALNHLREGIRRFQKDVYPQHRESYETAASTPQKPHTLIITCSDSRIDLETITGSGPGEIFAARNVGNMVAADQQGAGVAAVVEYAVDALKVKHAVVCGHTDCGAMKALKANSGLDALPSVKQWLQNAAEARSTAQSVDAAAGQDLSLRTLTEQNVLLQLAHLQAHPSVKRAVEEGSLTTSGWIYDIAAGDVLIHNPETKQFESTRNQPAQDTVAIKVAEETAA